MRISDDQFYVKDMSKHERIKKESREAEESADLIKVKDIKTLSIQQENSFISLIKNAEQIEMQKDAHNKAADNYQQFLKKSLWVI